MSSLPFCLLTLIKDVQWHCQKSILYISPIFRQKSWKQYTYTRDNISCLQFKQDSNVKKSNKTIFPHSSSSSVLSYIRAPYTLCMCFLSV